MNRRHIPWLRLGAEMAAIVLSILLAFWIDAWWDGVQERAAERDVLLGLRREFADHLTALEEAKAWSEEAARSATFLGASEAGRRDLTDSIVLEVERALSWVNSAYIVDLRGGVRDALVASGRLELIQEPGLREKLSSWNAVVDDVATNEATMRRFVMDVLTPYVAAQDVPLQRSLTWPVGAGSPEPPFAGLRARYATLLSQQQFQNLMSVRRLWDLGSQDKYRRALRETHTILDLVESELLGR